jgi:hypothetical protein
LNPIVDIGSFLLVSPHPFFFRNFVMVTSSLIVILVSFSVVCILVCNSCCDIVFVLFVIGADLCKAVSIDTAPLNKALKYCRRSPILLESLEVRVPTSSLFIL